MSIDIFKRQEERKEPKEGKDTCFFSREGKGRVTAYVMDTYVQVYDDCLLP